MIDECRPGVRTDSSPSQISVLWVMSILESEADHWIAGAHGLNLRGSQGRE